MTCHLSSTERIFNTHTSVSIAVTNGRRSTRRSRLIGPPRAIRETEQSYSSGGSGRKEQDGLRDLAVGLLQRGDGLLPSHVRLLLDQYDVLVGELLGLPGDLLDLSGDQLLTDLDRIVYATGDTIPAGSAVGRPAGYLDVVCPYRSE
jgi:hypothetical protein